MKLPKCGIAFLKAKAWIDFHSRSEIVGETWKDVFFGLMMKVPNCFKHESEFDQVLFPDHTGTEYRCICDCGEKKIFRTFRVME